jgi:hypothetical protein
MKAYQGTSTRVDQRHRRNLCEILDKAPAQDDESAVKWLLSMGFVQKPNLCPTCECKKIQGPCQQTRQNRSPWWFWRCSFWSCQTRLPFLTNSAFVGLRLQPKTLVQLILHYASSSLTKVVTRDDLVQAVNVGWQQGQHFLDVLTTQEAEAGELFCKTAVLSRSIECDATGLGRYGGPDSTAGRQKKVAMQSLSVSHPLAGPARTWRCFCRSFSATTSSSFMILLGSDLFLLVNNASRL